MSIQISCSDDAKTTHNPGYATQDASDIEQLDGDAAEVDAKTPQLDATDGSSGDDVDDVEVDAEAADADGGRDGDILDDDEFFECDCPDSGVCRIRYGHLWCVRPDLECGDEECPEDYVCTSDGFCKCDGGFEMCKPRCEKSDDCPDVWVCDLERNRCVEPPWCDVDTDCYPGEYCLSVPALDGRNACVRPGDKEVGESCSTDYECESGICRKISFVDDEEECKKRCFKETDCPEGSVCQWSSGTPGFCEEGRECEVDCGDELCSSGLDSCEPARCYHSGDCDGGNCVRTGHPYLNPWGECDMDVDYECKDNEFQRGDYCRLPERCDPEADEDSCYDPYECVSNGKERDSEGYAAWCSRPMED